MNIKGKGISLLHSIKRIILLVSIILSIFFTTSYALGMFEPVQVTRYTLSNGEKEIIFQEMRHIARGNFYERVHNDIINKKEEGYLYLYEGIFDYENAGKYYAGMKIGFSGDKLMEQPIHIGDISKNAINADLVYSVIDKKIEDKIKKENIKIESENKNSLIKKEKINFFDIDFGKSLQEKQQINIMEYTENKLYSVRFVENLRNKYNIRLQKTDGFDDFVIIDERNNKVVEEVYKAKQNKIYIQYGQEHFSGIYKGLKEKDKNWKITSSEKISVL